MTGVNRHDSVLGDVVVGRTSLGKDCRRREEECV